MVKKKSHEESHNESVSGDNSAVNKTATEADATETNAATEEGSPAGENVQIDELKVKLTEMQDKYLRLSAEFDNYRKRTLREKIELTKAAGEGVLVTILPVIDDFDRAMNSLRDTENCTAVKEGLQLIYNKMGDFLRQNGVSQMDVLDTPFNADIHEAVTNIAVEDEAKKGKVIDVIVKGYMLNDKVIRFPKVVVGE
ncbi:MAG: nucleotide exchange factor GrpE [Bacteroidales bacterium]|jgi:molecular chaperone GrpE|nr:nucleotide exchange factor GrpE [Bacteroidales bacterium]